MTHTIQQPGLHDYSWRPADDLMKQFVVEKSLPGGGWLALASHYEYGDAYDDIHNRERSEQGDDFRDYSGNYRVRDQFKNEAWVFIALRYPVAVPSE